MELARALCIRPGVTAVIGGGGKTSLLRALGAELSAHARVILCTTTHILPEPELPCVCLPSREAVDAALDAHPCILVGTPAEQGKLKAPGLSFPVLQELADFVIVEADGSRHRPVKAHAAHEPVIPPEANQTILVIGASAFEQPIASAVHRPELLCRWRGVSEDTLLTPSLISDYVNFESLHTRVLINQAESPRRRRLAKELAGRLKTPVCMASLQEGWITCLY